MARLSGTAGSLLARRDTGVIAVGPEDSVAKALRLMAERNIGAVVVLDGAGRLVGILSERDYARKVELVDRTAASTRVAEIMTADVVTVAPAAPIAECNALMHAHRVRHLPVLEAGRPVGVLSSRDVLERLVEEDERRIRALETERLMVDTGSY